MSIINWENFRRPDNTINLIQCFRADDKCEDLSDKQIEAGVEFVAGVELCQPIVSRQAASIALVCAFYFAAEGEE